MGSFSSGRYRTVNRGCIEDTWRIDIRQLRRDGFVREGTVQSCSTQWSRHGVGTASALLSIDLSNVACGALSIFYLHDGPPVSQTVQIASEPCRYGGHRFHFLCPVTGARVDVLALMGGQFVSRHAARLTYSSQSETKLYRLFRALGKAEARACGGDGFPRPRGRNRERQRERWWALEDAVEDLL